MIPFYEHARFVAKTLESLWLRRIYVPERMHSDYRHEFLFDFEEAFWLLHLEPGLVLHSLLTKRLPVASQATLPPFLQRFTSVSRGSRLLSFEVLPHDRVLRLKFVTAELIVECFGVKPNMLHFEGEKCVGAYFGKPRGEGPYQPPIRGQGKGQAPSVNVCLVSEVEGKVMALLQEKGADKLKAERFKQWQQQRRKAARELQKAFPVLYPYREAAIFLKSGVGPFARTLELGQGTLKLSERQYVLPRAHLADQLFQLAKKQEEKWAAIQARRETLQALLEREPSEECAPATKATARKGRLQIWKGPQYLTQAGSWILAGRGAEENRVLLKLLNGNDWWFHIRSKPGSHVGLIAKDQSLLQEDLLDAAQVVLMTSGGKSWGRVEVLYTRRKNVKHLKRSTSVTYTQEKTVSVSHEPLRWKALIERQGAEK
jgi:predicted ribosome quality control (RQC) complex YloA/Tae2 family protein